jgi:hypothetical protein
MHAHGHITVWGTHIGLDHATDGKGWYQQLKEWWAAHKSASHEAKLAAITARWDAKREGICPLHADAASDLVAPAHVFSTTTALCDLGV